LYNEKNQFSEAKIVKILISQNIFYLCNMEIIGVALMAAFALATTALLFKNNRKMMEQRLEMEDGELSETAKKVIGTEAEKPFELVNYRGETIKMGIYEAWYFNNVLKDRTARNKAWGLAKKGKYPFPEIKEMEKDWRATKDNPIKVSLPEKRD
jgi:hypothetical protein